MRRCSDLKPARTETRLISPSQRRSQASSPASIGCARQRRLRQRDDGVEAAEAKRLAVAELETSFGDFVGALRLAADQVQARLQAAVVVAEEQRVLAVGEQPAMDG